MTASRGPQVGGRTGFPGADGGDGGPGTGATDLIALLDALDLPIVAVQPDCTINFFNQAAAEVLDLSPSDVGRRPQGSSLLAGVPGLEERCRRATAPGAESRADFRAGDKWFVVRMSPYAGADRRVTGIVLTFTNVTAFRASVDQAIYERECTKAIVNTVADPLVVLSADHRIQTGNRAFYALFGLSRDEAHGVRLYGLGGGAFGGVPLRRQLEEMIRTGTAFQPVEVDDVGTAHGQRTLLLDAHPLSFPGHAERRVLVTFQDITTRKQAQAAKDLRSEEELRRSETFLAEGQRLSQTGSFSWKVATGEITWSEQLYRIYEIEIGVPVTPEAIRNRVHPDDLTLLEEMAEQARTGTHDFEWQYRLVMPDASIKYLHAVALAIRDHQGQLECIAAVQDVTARRMSEEALAKARSELAHVARVSSLGAMTASIAHEVNQPLSGIITNASTCLRMLAADPPNVEGARATARRTIRDGVRASEVITRLRELFSKREVPTEPVDLSEVARKVIALLLSELQSSRVVLRTELAERLPAVSGDRVQLQQVVLNLLRNGADAMSGVDDRPREMLVRTEAEGDRAVRLTVRDTGVGLAPDTLDRLFEAFYTTKNGGMGIGLSVSRSIIESHHGRLWAIPNDDGPGATFAFSVPCETRMP